MRICGPLRMQHIVDWNQEAKPDKKNLLLGSGVGSLAEVQKMVTSFQTYCSAIRNMVRSKIKVTFAMQCSSELVLIETWHMNLPLINRNREENQMDPLCAYAIYLDTWVNVWHMDNIKVLEGKLETGSYSYKKQIILVIKDGDGLY